MLPAYILTVEISTFDPAIGPEEFQRSCAPCLAYLDALKGAFDKRPASVDFQPCLRDGSKGWSARCVLMISLGRERAEYLVQLYQAIVNLIEFELPDYEVQAEIGKFQPS